MAVPFSNTKLRVPKGFQNILEGLAREILRNQPENPFEFGNKYFEQLLKVREETGHDPALHGARLEDRFYNNDSFKSPSVDPSSPQQQDAALTIQTNYRKHVAEQEVEGMKQDEAAEKIQAGFRGYQDRQKFTEMKSPEKQAEDEEVDIDLNDPDVEKAAVKIQAGFKGFKARQEIKDIKDNKKPKSPEPTPEPAKQAQEEEEVDINLDDPEVSAAALKIQAGFRGHQTRTQLKEKKAKKDGTSTEATDKSEIEGESQQSPDEVELPKTTEGETEGEQVEGDSETQATEGEAQKTEVQGETELTDGQGEAEKAQEEQVEKEEAKVETVETQDTEKKDESGQEEVDLDLEDPELAQAALKIQSGFRGHLARKEIEGIKESKQSTEKPKEEPVEEAKEGEENIDIDLNDPDTEKAALKIQAGFKGYQARKDIKAKKDAQETDTTEAESKPVEGEAPAEDEKKAEEADIDLNDPEVEKAAVKIQAGFKGFKTRQEIKAKQESGTDTKEETTTEEKVEEKTEETPAEGGEKAEGETVDIDLNDPEVAEAATKIQAGFKGYKTRQELKQKKESDSEAKTEGD